MAHNLTDADVFTSAVTVPDGGDARTAASVETPFQAVANRTYYNKRRMDRLGLDAGIEVSHPDGITTSSGPIFTQGNAIRANGAFEYCDALGNANTRQRVKMLPINTGAQLTTTPWLYIVNDGGNYWMMFIGNPTAADGLAWEVPVPTGAEVTLVRAGVQQGAAAATAMKMEVWQCTQDKTVPFSSRNVTSLGSDSTSGAVEDVLSVAVSHTQGATNMLLVTIHASSSGSTMDSIFWLEVTFDDPGPRNY